MTRAVSVFQNLLLNTLSSCPDEVLCHGIKLLLRAQLPTLSHIVTIKAAQGVDSGDDVILPVLPLCGGVANEVELSEIRQFSQVINTFFKVLNLNEVQRQVQFLQRLAPSYALYQANIVHSEVDIFELLELGKAFHSLDEVVLQVQDLQMAAVHVQIAYLLDTELMQGNL